MNVEAYGGVPYEVYLQLRCPQPSPRPAVSNPIGGLPYTRTVVVDGKIHEAANVWRELLPEIWNDRAEQLLKRYTHLSLSRSQILMCSRWWEEPTKMMELIAMFCEVNQIRNEQLRAAGIRRDDFYPDASTPSTIFNGIAFCETPICHIRTSKNNTILNITDYLGQSLAYHSCGLEGFKNARKGTNVAAQATAIALATKAKDKGVHSIRVKIEGLGPGRMSSVKGLQMAGLKIISVTDSTHISWSPPRPRKQRRL